jgi:beta-ureidopropionase / N-carbamoyl-L-amino-acid hydrolase
LTPAPSNTRIDGDLLWADLMSLAEITDPAMPYTRRSFSPRFLEGRHWLEDKFKAAGLTTRIDAGGNLIGRLEGSDPSLGTLMIGSHSDTVPSGGRFDGIAGVLSGLEIVRALQRAQIQLAHAIEIVDFLAEEPSEFGLSCIGSRAMSGLLYPHMLANEDGRGRQLGPAINAVGGDVNALATSVRNDIAAYLELHIEQGIVLERSQIDLGIVTGIAGISRFEVIFLGSADHSGTTPMSLRRDAGVAGADLVVFIAELARRLAKGNAGHFVATCGIFEQFPNAANVIPGKSRIIIDARAEQRPNMETFRADLEAELAEIARRYACEHRFGVISDTMPAPCDPFLQDVLTNCAASLGYSTLALASGAGHDAAFLSRIAPSAMIFVPSKGGKSHVPEEWTEPSELYAGASTLLETILQIDARSPQRTSQTDRS